VGVVGLTKSQHELDDGRRAGEAPQVHPDAGARVRDLERAEGLELPTLLHVDLRRALGEEIERRAEAALGAPRSARHGGLHARVARDEPHDDGRLRVVEAVEDDRVRREQHVSPQSIKADNARTRFGAIQPQTSVHLDSARGWSLRSWRNGQSADTADKARTARLRGEENCCGANKSDCFYKTHAAEATSCSASPQEALSPTAERSVLCPQCPRFVRVFMSVETRPSWVLH